MKGDYDFEVRLKLKREDVLELVQLRDRAQVESRDFASVPGYVGLHGMPSYRFTDKSRNGQHSLDTLNRILEQIRL